MVYLDELDFSAFWSVAGEVRVTFFFRFCFFVDLNFFFFTEPDLQQGEERDAFLFGVFADLGMVHKQVLNIIGNVCELRRRHRRWWPWRATTSSWADTCWGRWGWWCVCDWWCICIRTKNFGSPAPDGLIRVSLYYNKCIFKIATVSNSSSEK